MKTSTTLLTLILLLVASPLALALASDRDQPIQISADSGEINEAAGISTYAGNVTIDQGSMHIAADEVEVIINDKRVVQIVARTEPDSKQLARYEHLPDDSEAPVLAQARQITYLVQEELLKLSGEASLQQRQDSFAGETLSYDVNLGTVNLKSSEEAGDRIKMTISPRPK